MHLASSRFASLGFALLLVPVPLACGDDGDDDTGAETGPVLTTNEGTSSTGDASTSTAGQTDTSSSGTVDGTSSTGATSADEDSTTGAPAGDPAYPPPEGGECPDGTLSVALPGAEICAPFCGGPDDVCPPAATGEAEPACIPFAGPGGSGDACDEITKCPAGETCSDGSCSEIAFYACQLRCGMGEVCPDGMECSGIATCGYP